MICGLRFGMAATAVVRLSMAEIQAMRRVALLGPCGSISPNVLKHLDDDQAVFMLKSPVRAAIVTPVEQEKNEAFMMLIMPIKLNS